MYDFDEKPKNDFMGEKPKNDYTYVEPDADDYRFGYELADIGSRLIALAIDTLLISFVISVLTAGSRSFWGTLIGLMIGAGYQWYFLTHNKGQTIGKRLLGVRVVRLDGQPLTGVDAVIRYAGYYINTALLSLGWVWALFDGRHQGFHDKLVNTVVVKA